VSRVRILFLTHRFPYPPNQGGKIRPFNMIRHLTQAHEVTVATLVRSQREADAVPELQRQTGCRVLAARVGAVASSARALARVFTATPSSMGYFYSPRLARAIHSALEETAYNLILAHCSSVAPYVTRAATPKILDFGDMDSQKWLAYADSLPAPLSFGYRLEGRKLERAERRLAEEFDLSICTTPAELESLHRLTAPRASDYVPNGVDGDYFKPTAEPYDHDQICFLGRMDYYPNRDAIEWFCAEVLPLARARRPGIKLTIIGSRPPRRIRALARIPGVTVTGSVPDVRPYAQRAALSVAPLRIARGTQNKILESLAMGVPVVSSALAARGVDAVAGEHLLTATQPREYVDCMLRLLENRHEHARFAAAGRARALSHHNWQAPMHKLDELIGQCLQRARSRGRS